MVQLEFEQSGQCNFDRSYVGYNSYMQNSWAQVAETTLPLKTSKLASANQCQFQASIELRSKQISQRVILVNLVSVLVNLLLAAVAFYFAFANNSPSTQAFATDCILDFVSSAILLWRYYGDISSVFMHAREQIACIYLGALFVLSSTAIIIKAISDIASDSSEALAATTTSDNQSNNELVYLAAIATVACSIMTVFKCALYKTLRDNSILLDVINTLISTVFAISIVMSQALINVDPSFWYLDPVLSVVLALFMMGFGLKVIHQNFNVLKPVYDSSAILVRSYRGCNNSNNDHSMTLLVNNNNNNSSSSSNNTVRDNTTNHNNYGANLNLSFDKSFNNWQKTDYSTITFN